MSEIRVSDQGGLAFFTASDAEQRVSAQGALVFFTEVAAGHELRSTAQGALVFYTGPTTTEPEGPDCSFGSSFQPGVLRGQGVCE